MGKCVVVITLCLMFFIPCRSSYAIVVDLSKHDVADAIKSGGQQGSQVTNYVERHYRFGEENAFEESGKIRTKWGKLMVLSGLLAAKGMQPTEEERERIVKSTELQIDIHTFGNTIDFAHNYKVHLMQGGKLIEPEKISADHTAYLPEKMVVTPGFPKYRATVRSYFPYDKINPEVKTEVVLVKNKKKVVFEVNFADYK